LELWITKGHSSRGEDHDLSEDIIYKALEPIKNLHRLKLVIARGKYDRDCFKMPTLMAKLRERMMKNPKSVEGNPIWAAFDIVPKLEYSLAMCHDHYSHGSLLTKTERRYFQSDQVHEFRGTAMEKFSKLDM
jgi:hypothetical protein